LNNYLNLSCLYLTSFLGSLGLCRGCFLTFSCSFGHFYMRTDNSRDDGAVGKGNFTSKTRKAKWR